jgi:hypothetical protein
VYTIPSLVDLILRTGFEVILPKYRVIWPSGTITPLVNTDPSLFRNDTFPNVFSGIFVYATVWATGGSGECLRIKETLFEANMLDNDGDKLDKLINRDKGKKKSIYKTDIGEEEERSKRMMMERVSVYVYIIYYKNV